MGGGPEGRGGAPVDSFDRTLDAAVTPVPSPEDRVVVRRNTPVAVPAQRYERLSIHAEGGLGRVWRARDHLLDREVALKDVRPDADGDGTRRRLVEEAKISGRLEHPGIVPVYDIATGSAPFYTMRMVAGRTLGEVARAYHAGPGSAVELRRLLNAFVMVCNTIEYAHARGVIHRDLKGSNILVGDYGEVIVLDWGVAKRRDDDEEHPDELLGTPAYMAPEQVRRNGEAIDERTDVYGLGALLYEVLTGRPPFEGDSLDAVLRRVVEDAPTPPRAIAPGTAPALQAIALRALARDRAHRYPSARALGDDVQRYLADERVTAYRDGVIARVARFARRHRSLTVGAAALTVTVAIALAVGTFLLQRANAQTEAQRDQARRNFLEARDAVDTYLTTVSEEQLLDAPGLQPLRERLLADALAYYQRFAAEHGDDPSLTLELADAQRRLGDIMGELGRGDEALAQLDAAIATYQRLPADHQRARLGIARAQLAIAQIAPPLKAIVAAQAAIEAFEPLAAAHPDDPTLARQLGRSHDLLGVGRSYSEGDAHGPSAEAVRILEAAATRFPDDAETGRLLALAYVNRGTVFSIRGELTPAALWYQKAIEAARATVAARPEDQLARRELARAAGAMSTSLFTAGAYTAALAPIDESVATLRALARENPRVESYQRLLALAMGRQGETLLAVGRVTEARPFLEEAMRLTDGLVASAKNVDDATISAAWWHYVVARAAARSGDPATRDKELAVAAGLYDAAIAHQPDNSWFLSDSLWTAQAIVEARRADGTYPPATAPSHHDQIVARRRAVLALAVGSQQYQGELADALLGAADAHRVAGNVEEVRVRSAEALTIIESLAAASPEVLSTQALLARALITRAWVGMRTGDRNAALADLARARTVLSDAVARDLAYLPPLACLETAAIETAEDRAAQTQIAVAVVRQAQAAGVEAIEREPCLAPIANKLR